MSPGRHDEQGVYLVLWAVLVTALLIMVAIVIDLGNVRDSRRRSQLTADFASIAAGKKLAGTADASGVFVVDTQGACADAFEYIKTNTRDLPSTATMSGAGGCGVLPTACTNDEPAATPPAVGTPSADAIASSSEPYTITVRYPVWDTEIADSARPTPGTGDGKMCERMKVTVERNNATMFAGIIGVTNLSIRASSVVRGFGTSTPQNIPALALLERVGCGVLYTSSASPSSRLIIKAINPTNPGIIQADSYGIPSQGGCNPSASGPEQRTNNIVFGKATPANLPSIETEDCHYNPPATPTSTCLVAGSATTSGQLALNAVRVGSPFDAFQLAAATACPGTTCGIRSTLGAGDVVSRRAVDDKYLTELNALKASSDSLLNRANNIGVATGRADLIAAGYRLYPDSYGVACGALPPAATEIVDDRVLINNTCDLNPTGSSLTFSGRYIIVAGQINVGTGRTLSFSNAKELFVAGCSANVTDYGPPSGGGCGNSATGGQNNGINIGGNLFVNGQSAAAGACPASTASYLPGQLVLRTGRFVTSTSSVVALCQTFVYMSGVRPATNGISQSVSGSVHASCTVPPATTPPTPGLPCPQNTENYTPTTTAKYLGYTEIQGTVRWIAPNRSPLLPRNRTQSDQEFEDIALWTEGSVRNAIKGTGTTDTTGLFFFPNATFEFQGQSCTTPRDAQFFSQRLELSGTSCFIMQPLPQNAIFTPKPSYSLIR